MPERNLLHLDVKDSFFLFFCCIINIDNGRLRCAIDQMIYRFIGLVSKRPDKLKR